MTYSFELTRKCEVDETLYIEVTADSEAEARDLAYELASTHPYSSLVADRIRIEHRDYNLVSNIGFLENEEETDSSFNPFVA